MEQLDEKKAERHSSPCKKLQLADSNPYLNYDALVEACEQIFGHKKFISYAEFREKTKESYRIDMEDYASMHNFLDAVKIVEYFAYVRAKIEEKIPVVRRSNKIMVIGCGQGRLIEVYLSLAGKMGIKQITFNDLIEEHVQQTADKIRSIYGADGLEANGVKIEYLTGDFSSVDIAECFDAVFLIWYVSAEFLDPSSVENIRLFRENIYRKISDLMIPGGGLIEDIPDPNMDPGFYEIANFKTTHILQEKGILLGEHHNLLLSNWTCEQKSGFPYQLRYTARNGTDVREKARAGFALRKTESLSLPVRSLHRDHKVVMNTLEEMHDIWEIISLLQQLILQTVKFPPGNQLDQKRRKITWWEKSE